MTTRYAKIIERGLIALIALVLIATGWMWGDLRKRDRAVPSLSKEAVLEFTLTNQHVLVFHRGQSQPFQEIAFEPSALTDDNRPYFIQTPDINFDGYPDLLLIFSQGAQNIFYDGWIWNPSTHRFVYSPEIRYLPSPAFDEATKQIHTFMHGSATDNSQATYVYRNGVLTEIARIDQIFDEASNLFVLTYYELNDQGKLVEVREERLTEEALDARNNAP